MNGPRLISITDRDGYTLYPPHTEGTFRQTSNQRAALRAFAEKQRLQQLEQRHRRALALMDAFEDEDDDADLLALSVIASAQQDKVGMMSEELPTRRNPVGPQATRQDQARERSVIIVCAVVIALLLVLAAVFCHDTPRVLP